MRASGIDGEIVANDTHLTIIWKSLRGRLSNIYGSSLEIIELSKILDITLIPASPEMRGCLQLHLVRKNKVTPSEFSWMTDLHQKVISHGIMFDIQSQFEFYALTNHVSKRILMSNNFLENSQYNQEFNN